MDDETTREQILGVLRDIAPEADLRGLVANRPLREQIDLDSLDWINLVDRVGERLGAAFGPGRLAPTVTLDEWVQAARAARRSPRPRPGGQLASVRRLADGRRVRLRPVGAADAPLLAEFVRRLSLASRQRRFMVSLRELPPSKLKALAAVDQHRHIALAATEVGSGRRRWIGVARCIADADGEGCEFALTVADEWQGTGLAGLLMRALMDAARARGLRSMHGEVLASNRPMLTLARQLGFALRQQPGDPGTMWVTRAL